ncbi:MAG: TRAP transporter substrate-binding protein [Deltaproteobacteria bacterium]|nr:TRAP transporter substrate-binding protein [Deltaproteobacteria bacterium]
MSDTKLKPLETTRRNFMVGTAAAVSTFFIGRSRAHAGDAEITLKIATVAPDGTPWSKHMNRLKKRVKEETGGRVKIKPYLGGALGDEQNTLERCVKGGIAGWAGSTGAFMGLIPEMAALELPYLFPDVKAADTILDTHVKADIERMLDKAGLKLLFFSENGHRSLGTNFGFVKSTGDLKGKKIRVQPGDLGNWMLAAMGASPQAISVVDTMTALQTGVVEGFDNTPLFTFAASWYQAISHFTLTKHSYQPAMAVLSKQAWEELPEDVRSIIVGDAQAESEYGRKGVRKIEPDLEANFEAAGIALHRPSASEIAAFKKATESVHKKFTDKFGSTFYKAITKHL